LVFLQKNNQPTN